MDESEPNTGTILESHGGSDPYPLQKDDEVLDSGLFGHVSPVELAGEELLPEGEES